MDEERISWHQAFYGAVHLELEEYRDILEFHTEYPLTTEPLRIDALIIKKKAEVVIKKNIAAIFRRDNIIEYKGPGDTLSVAGFSKTMAYCYLYSSLNNLPVTEITLTLVVNGYPRRVVEHLGTVYGWEAREREGGIHEVRGSGMAFPIQIIESRKLGEGENLWLVSLREGLGVGSLRAVLRESALRKDDAALGVYIHMLLRANRETLEEVLAMGDATLEEVLERSGITAKWEARGRAEGETRGRAEGETRGRAEGETRGRAEAEARDRRRFIELVKSGKSVEELLKMYEEEGVEN
jgi:hypothetical protein